MGSLQTESYPTALRPETVERICMGHTLADFREEERRLNLTPAKFMKLRAELLRKRYGI